MHERLASSLHCSQKEERIEPRLSTLITKQAQKHNTGVPLQMRIYISRKI